MPKKKSYPTVTDQFCGAGGSTQGAKASGAEVLLAMNHWKLATETYATNNQNTLIDCTDVSASDPRRYPSTDILITSPECTNHSLAKGVKIVKKQMELFISGKLDPAAERSRATMWDVPRFAEYHGYNGIIVENVVDARKWVMFDAWLKAMHLLGYSHKCCYHNSMHHHPTPQSRDRMYVVFWKKGNQAPDLNFMPDAWCNKCEHNVQAIQSWKKDQKSFKYKTGYEYCCPKCSSVTEPYYYAAFNCIDWSDIGKRIGDRKKPLSPNSIKRITYGIDKYSGEQFIINNQHSTGIDFRVRGLYENVQTITSTHQFNIVQPFIIKNEHHSQEGYAREVFETSQTQATRQTMALVTPFIVDGNYDAKASRASSINETFQTISTQHRTGLSFITESRGTGKTKQITDRLPAVMAGGNNHGLVTNDSWNSFIAQYYNGSHCVKHISEEIGTVTTGDRSALVTYQKPKVDDCYYRMLKPHEIQAAMAFERDYKVLGSGKDKVRQLGNAVTPPVMKWLVNQVMHSLK